MEPRKISRSVALPFSLMALCVFAAPAYANGTTINIPHQCGSVSLTAASPLTIVSGQTLTTRGNTQAFANAATGVMTINGQAVSPVESEVYQQRPDNHPDGNADDPWRVQWSFTTATPAQGQSIVVTFNIDLAYPVAVHELGPGQPVILPAGPLYSNPLTCTVLGI